MQLYQDNVDAFMPGGSALNTQNLILCLYDTGKKPCDIEMHFEKYTGVSLVHQV